jgi:nucleotide-binding universal stress UspA family protein
MDIVCAVDSSEDSFKTLREAETLVEQIGGNLKILHCIEHQEFRQIQSESHDHGNDPIMMDEILSMAETRIHDVASELAVPYTAVPLFGNPSSEIIDYVDTSEVDYIVLGGTKRSAAGKILFGSVTQSVLLNSSVPVLMVPTVT